MSSKMKEYSEDKVSENLYPYGYDDLKNRYTIALLDIKDQRREEMDAALEAGKASRHDKNRMDAFRLYTGLPQINNTFKVSDYKPGRSGDPNAVYYGINMEKPEYKQAMVNRFDQVLQQYDDVSSLLGIDKNRAMELKEKHKLFPEQVFSKNTESSHMSGENRVTELLKRATGKYAKSLDNSERYELYDFLKDAGDERLANKIFKDSKEINLNDADIEKLNVYKQFTEVLHQYVPKTNSVMWNDGINMIMGNYNLSKGKDPETGRDYVSYKDTWDLAPGDFGKSFEIYDRIYLDELKKK
jgi:hypothetical protein